MSTFAEQCEAARRELYEAQAAARRDAADKPVKLIIAELNGDKQARNNQGLAARAAMWGSPSGSSFASGKMGRPAVYRNARLVTGYRNTRYTT